MPIARLATEQDLTRAVHALAGSCAMMRALHKRHGIPPLRKIAGDFSGLVQIIVSQQLSAHSAQAILTRVRAGVQPFDAPSLAAMLDADLARLGLSRPKVKTLKALADTVAAGKLDLARLRCYDEARVAAELTALHGIGPWTAEIYLLFALRRADAFPAGDLALQIAAQRIFELDQRPSPEALITLAERWRPWRGAAARLLWVDYSAAAKQQRLPRAAKIPDTALKQARPKLRK